MTDRIVTRRYCYRALIMGGILVSITLIGVGAGMGIPAAIIGGVLVLGVLTTTIVLYRN
jgi:hypothetical protein